MPSTGTSTRVGPASADVVIVGGGASGVAVTIHLVRRLSATKTPSIQRIVLVEPQATVGPGLAYSGACAGTIINMHRDAMGLWNGDPRHFSRWVNERELEIDDYPSRGVYGTYLEYLWYQAVEEARQLGVEVCLVADEVQDIDRRDDGTFSLALASGKPSLSAQDVVLAVGNFSAVAHPHFSRYPGFFPFPWPTTGLKAIPTDAPVLVLGSRLSAIDVVNVLYHNGHRGEITFVSRSGRLPKVQSRTVPFPHRHTLYTLAKEVESCPDRGLAHLAGGVLHAIARQTGDESTWMMNGHHSPLEELRADLEDAEEGRGQWQSILRATAPLVERYWHGLGDPERDLFMKRLNSGWMRYRHGMPVSSAKRLLTMMEREQLHVRKGTRVAWNGSCFEAQTDGGPVQAPYLIEAIGQESDVSSIPSGAVQSVIRKNLAVAHPYGGLVVDFNNLNASPGLYAIGSLTRGTHFYVSSVDRIAEHAARIADALTGQPTVRSQHIALFLSGDLFSHLLASRLVPQLLAAGHIPFLFILPAPTAISEQGRLLEHALMQKHVVPFLAGLEPSQQNEAQAQTLDALAATHGLFLQTIDDCNVKSVGHTMQKHAIDHGIVLQCSTSPQPISDAISRHFVSTRKMVHLCLNPRSAGQPFSVRLHKCGGEGRSDSSPLHRPEGWREEYTSAMLRHKRRVFSQGADLAMAVLDRLARAQELERLLFRDPGGSLRAH
ncbi:FAD/NAD(P)-binding protein [Aspergillus homomorphus CBS 101889]|uniref:FAD/NAD(P)-binding domain-containing protein n=1 Tax=Aspergillus homomorphus (strain CBS 101889) TaxID=1450537 RepID=A0A395HM02_ASPHC|nr:FAD/NAD(P)-binding domain-containing protein [Aspergillus homomorphus CBS 101889]RAL08877.1 FAD/NAD(P)-binding domain-containing protein [Aspergillus homomorphus CBS 101889]